MLENGERFDLYYRSPFNKKIHALARFHDFYVMLHELKKLTHFVRNINLGSESITVIEHLLLLTENTTVAKSFYDSAVTIVLPGWTSRFAGAEFRSRATPIILQQLPAHLQANILWLNFDSYKTFETLYADVVSTGDIIPIDQQTDAKNKLAEFLYKKENRS